MNERITTRLAAWMGEAVDQHSQGDEILWDLVMGMSPQGPMAIAITTMKGAILDTVIHNQIVLQSPTVATREEIGRMVQGMLGGLREERTRQLSQVNGNGPHEHPEGLHLPHQH